LHNPANRLFRRILAPGGISSPLICVWPRLLALVQCVNRLPATISRTGTGAVEIPAAMLAVAEAQVALVVCAAEVWAAPVDPADPLAAWPVPRTGLTTLPSAFPRATCSTM